MVYFIIVYGSYGITYSKGKGGSFHCPSCAAAKTYRHRRVRRFFHIFFIPLIPLTLAGEYVECGQCKGTYKLEVLDATKTLASGQASGQAAGAATAKAPAPESQRGVRRILALMLLADGKVDEAEIQFIMQYLSRTENRPVSRDDVLAELDAARRDKTDLESYCRSLMGYLNKQGRRDVLDAAHMVASADGHVDPNEQRMLERLGIALGLRPSEVSTALASQVQRLYPPTATAAASAPMPVAAASSTPMPAASMPMAAASMPMHAATPRAPFCPQCGTPGRWIAEHNVWGCDRCRIAIPTPS